MSKTHMERRVKALIDEDPEAFTKAVLSHLFWPGDLASDKLYRRYGDDDCGYLDVSFGQDSDAWIEICSNLDPEEINLSHRFRTPGMFGGGESPHTRQALILLAAAIELDNACGLQDHRARRYAEKLEEHRKILQGRN